MLPQSTANIPTVWAPDGTPCEPLAPGSPAWYRTMSASKVAAVLDASDYDSPRSLWNKMAGLDYVPDDGDDTTRRGHYLEPAIAAWYGDQHPDWIVAEAFPWVSTAYPWAIATPDRHVHTVDGRLVLLECKSSTKPDEWGAPGTDEVPTGYYWQCQWQMFVTGCTEVHVAMIGAFLAFAEYRVERNADDIAWLLRQCGQFMASLPSEEASTGAPYAGSPPPVDGHRETLPSVQRVYGKALTGETTADVGDAADEYLAAFHGQQAAEERKRRATAAMLDAAGTADRLVQGEQTIATVSITKTGTASVRPNPGAVKATRHVSTVVEDRF